MLRKPFISSSAAYAHTFHPVCWQEQVFQLSQTFLVYDKRGHSQLPLHIYNLLTQYNEVHELSIYMENLKNCDKCPCAPFQQVASFIFIIACQVNTSTLYPYSTLVCLANVEKSELHQKSFLYWNKTSNYTHAHTRARTHARKRKYWEKLGY